MGSASAQLGATALNFDGSNDYVSIPVDPAFNVSSAITIEAWINPSKTTGTQDILSKSNATSNNGYIFPRTSDGWKTIEFLANINGYGWKVLKVNYGVAKLNQWHHVAATYDGLKMRIFIDGVQAGEFAFAGSITVNNNPLSLGNQVGFSEYFGGTVDELRVWNRALTGCEINNNLTCQLNVGIQTGLIAYYQFNQGLLNILNTGLTTLNDSSPTGANGTLINFGLVGLLSNWAAGTVGATTCLAYAPPIISASAAQTTVPIGGTISLVATSSNPSSTFAWAGPNGFNSSTQNPVLTGVSSLASGLYTVTITTNGCSLTASVLVSVAGMASGLNFDGVDDNITVPYNSSLSSNTFTVEAWINPSPNITPIQDVVSNASRFADNGFQFPKTNDGWNSISFELSVNNSWKVLTATFPTSALGQWNHVAATYDGFFMKIYINGALSAVSEVVGNYTSNTNNITIGNREGLSQFYKGSIDELRIWNRAQSQCEIINNMKTCELNGANNGLAQQVGLASYYRFNQGLTGLDNTPYTTLADSSGHANNGTLYNFALTGTTSTWIDGKVNGLCDPFVQPLLSASANGSSFQVGSTVKLFANNGNNNTYTWDGPNAFSTTLQNPVINSVQPNQSGTYTVTTPYTNCVVTASTRVNITTASLIVPDGPTAICPNGSVGLSTATTGTAYQWYKDDVAIAGATANQYRATQAGNYTVTITNGADVIVSAGLAVTIVPDATAPVADLSSLPTVTINNGGSVTTIPTATDNCRGAVSGTANRSLTFTTPGTFTITWTYDDLNGNRSTQTQQVVVLDNIAPVLTLPSNITKQATAGICSAVATYTATATDNSGGPVTITYSPNSGSSFAIGVNTVTVTATDASNNSVNGTFTVTVTPAPVAPITGTTGLCVGSTSTLATTTTGGSWSSDNTAVATINASGVVTAQSVGTAVITYTDACGSTATATVTVGAQPAAPVVSVVNNCGNSVLSTTATGTLLWNTNATTSSITVTTGGSYSVTQTVNGCTSTPGSAIAAPTARPAAPSVTVTNNCGTSTLSASATGTLLWSTGASTASITVATAGNYTVTQTVGGCTSLAASVTAAPIAAPATPVVTVVDGCGSSTLSTNATGSLVWSTGATGSSITVTTAGAYTVTQTVNGCVSGAGSGTAAPKAVPAAPSITAVNNCGNTVLSTNAVGTLSWSTGATTSSITVTTGGNYSVTVTNGGCSASSTIAATVNAIPTVAAITGTTSVASGSTTQLADVTAGGVWSSSNTAVATVSASGLVTGVSTGSATITYTVTNAGCSNAVTANVTVTASCVTPVFTTVNTINANVSAGCSAPVTYTVSVTGNPTLSYTFTGATTGSGSGTGSGASFTTGTTLVTVKAVNPCGTVYTSFNVIVKDVTVPTVITKNITVSLDANGQAIIAPSQVDNGSYDNCGPVSLSFRTTTSSVTTGTICATADENGNVVLTAPSGATITAINFASYGTPNGTCGSFTLGGCNAANSKSIVEGYALGKNTVTIPATNTVFGDPCPGTYKRLYVQATYQSTVTTTSSSTTPTLSFGCSNKGANTVTLNVTDAAGNVNTQTAVVTVQDNTAPVITTAVPNQSICGAAGNYTIPALVATDNCSATVTYSITGATTRSGSGSNASGTFNTGTSLITWTVTDGINTTSATTTVTVGASPAGTITASNADAFCNKVVLTASSTTTNPSFKWISPTGAISTNTQLSLGSTDADGVYQMIVTTNGCASTATTYNYQKQNVASNYTILGFSQVQLGYNNTVGSGGVGVTSPWGYVALNGNTNITAPGTFVKSSYIAAWGWGINVANPIWSAANGITLPTMYKNTVSAGSYPSYTVNPGVTTTLNGNYKTLTLKKGSTTILNGTIFGSITIEQGAQVTFTAATVNIDKLKMNKGPRYGYTYIRFSQDTKVLVSSSVSVSSNCFINPDNNNVTFYLGDNSPDAEKFTATGGDSKINANIYAPTGIIKVTGGYRYGDYGGGYGDCDRDDDDPKYYGQGSSTLYMTGFYIADQVIGYGNNVTWNTFDCSAPAVAVVNAVTQQAVTSSATKEGVATVATSEEDLKITVMPNPSTTYFTLKFESKFETPVNMRVMDANGRVIDAKSKIGSNSTIQIGANYASGTYYAEMIQGTQRKVVQLMKVK